MADLEPHTWYHRDHLITGTRASDTTTSPNTSSNIASPRSHGLTPRSGRAATQRIYSTAPRAPAPRWNKLSFVIIGDAPHTRLGGGQPLSIPSTTRPYAHAYKETSLHKHKHVLAPTTAVTPGPDLLTITRIEDWANLLQTHNRKDFAKNREPPREPHVPTRH